MLRTDKPIYKSILILNLIFIVAGIVLSAIGITSAEANATRIVCLILAIICLLFGAYYIISGYTKNAAMCYKLYGALLAIKFLVEVLSGSINSGTTFAAMVRTLSLVLVLVMILSENLGKSKSLILCGLFVALRVALLIYVVIGNMPMVLLVGNIVNIDLACLFGIMTYAKYLDKEERGTK